MAEESGKGIALVILGIVAIIAIVGLVLLFTGARKAAVGEFAVPAAKEYGGAVKGVYDPISRAFSGRANEYPAGTTAEQSAQWQGRAGVAVGGQAYGDYADPSGRQFATNSPRLLTQSGNYFQAYENQGTVRKGDACWFETTGRIEWTSNVDHCQYRASRGELVSSLPALCTGEVSRGRMSSSGYGNVGQSTIAVDKISFDPSRIGKGACAYIASGLQTI